MKIKYDLKGIIKKKNFFLFLKLDNDHFKKYMDKKFNNYMVYKQYVKKNKDNSEATYLYWDYQAKLT